ncbi:MAG: PLxRFG domain-containing protein, partial [Azovibrio sp.]
MYDTAHQFIDDVSRFANEAADHAKNILPHLDTWKDMAVGMRRALADSGDYKSIAPAIFQGTLANGTTGKVWTDQELVKRFGLNQKQINLYREFRAAVDSSLETLAKSELARAAKAENLMLANPNLSLDDSLYFYLEQDGSEFIAKSFKEKVGQIRKLQAEGYAPLMRFGQYTVDVVRKDDFGNPVLDHNGEQDRPFFGMFESEAEAIESAKILQQEYPGYSVSRGILSEETSRLYKGITPEAAEMFAKMLGADSHAAFQTYLKQAVANRSAMKRLIDRKGMDGFANDVPRVLSAFITSTARLSSGNWHMGDIAKAVNEIPDSLGDVKDHAIQLLDYIQNPKDEASWLRGLLFFNFLGGSVAAALVNTTQTFTTTLPYLSQFGTRSASSAITKAMGVAGKAMAKGIDAIKDAELKKALTKAAEDGVVDPQEIHLLMAEVGGNGASNLIGRITGVINKEWATPATRVTRSFTQAWGSFFSMAEKYNRHVAFMAAWDVAGGMSREDLKQAGAVNRYEFAKNTVLETQFDYTKVSRPNWARGVAGATLFTFKTFIVNYLEFLVRLPARERAMAIAVLMLFSGLSGAPGIDDLDDVIDTIG